MTHRHAVRVYFQDTDAGGVVHHATMINFLERARTEWLRQKGFGQAQLAEATQTVFVVRQLSAEYLAPAFLDEKLTVQSRVTEHSRASVRFEQTVTRDDSVLVRATLLLVCVHCQTFKPTAIPAALLPLESEAD